jgi:uncharacterized protein with ParB-like and HNH nuclease domain
MTRVMTDHVKAHAKTVGEPLNKGKYKIHLFQREYKRQTKQIEQLIQNLEEEFRSKSRSL